MFSGLNSTSIQTRFTGYANREGKSRAPNTAQNTPCELTITSSIRIEVASTESINQSKRTESVNPSLTKQIAGAGLPLKNPRTPQSNASHLDEQAVRLYQRATNGLIQSSKRKGRR